jgi:hypothetical protein
MVRNKSGARRRGVEERWSRRGNMVYVWVGGGGEDHTVR